MIINVSQKQVLPVLIWLSGHFRMGPLNIGTIIIVIITITIIIIIMLENDHCCKTGSDVWRQYLGNNMFTMRDQHKENSLLKSKSVSKLTFLWNVYLRVFCSFLCLCLCNCLCICQVCLIKCAYGHKSLVCPWGCFLNAFVIKIQSKFITLITFLKSHKSLGLKTDRQTDNVA